MVKRLRLNDKTVREQIPEAGRDYQVFDTEVRGFSIRILRSGSRSFSLDYRYAGAQRRMAIEHETAPFARTAQPQVLVVEDLGAVSYTHLTLPTSDLV